MNGLEQKLQEFCQAVEETKEYQNYKNAAKIYDADKMAQKLLEDFQMARQELAILGQGNFSGQEEQKEKVEILLKEVQKSRVIGDWIISQRQLESLVGDLAATVSNRLDFPFTLPPKKGCGCSG